MTPNVQERPSAFSHSGSLGDVIYSLPFCIAKSGGGPFSMHLLTGVRANYASPHPAGTVRMSEDGANAIVRLLRSQPYVSGVTVSSSPLHKGEFYDLDRFRGFRTINLSAGSISQWYDMTEPAMFDRYDLSRPWIDVEDDGGTATGDVVIFRSTRYNRSGMNFSPLRRFAGHMLFIGLESEWRRFCSQFFTVRFHRIEDFYEAACIMKRAKFVVGNQTGLFSVAEAMKVPRILESAFECPNVVMNGGSFSYVVHPSLLIDAFESYWDHFVGRSPS